MKYQELISQMTLEEKASLCSGYDMWNTKRIERLNIPSIMVTDGPHGLRKKGGNENNINKSVESTCFPTASCAAATWNRELISEMGRAIGEEALQEDVAVVLGPGANIKRSSICGRNFEYYSEDPLLSGKLAGSFIKGLQSTGLGTSLKHFLANNQETRRMTVSSEIDERTLHEIYLKSFEYAVKEGKPKTLMCSYNRLNGEYCCEHKEMLTGVLRDKWGFEGIVMSDWGATNCRPKGLDAGLELEMPSSGGYNDLLIVKAVKDGELSEDVLDNAVDKLLDLIFTTSKALEGDYQYSKIKHNDLARKIAADGGVLLKNYENVLPLDPTEKILVVGEMAMKPRYQGAGSSHICPYKLTSFVDALTEEGVDYEYVRGYKSAKSSKIEQKLIIEAVNAAKNYDKVVVFAGLTDQYEAEGYDRANIDMPISHIALINELVKVNRNVIVVLSSGSAIAMPFKDDVSAILMMHLGGQNVGGATYDLLFGRVNPSGKLAETYPIALEDISSYNNMLGDFSRVEYREGIYVGYRYFDTAKKNVLFPFGYGLSYTTFEYKNIKVNNNFASNGTVNVTFDLVNTGKREGSEVVQCYVSRKNKNIFVPEKELKAFEKVELKVGETKKVTLTLDKDAFSSYIVESHDFEVVGGEYDILLGTSSQDIKLKHTIELQANMFEEYANKKELLSWYYNPQGNDIPLEQYEILLGRPLLRNYILPKKGSFTQDNTFEEMEQTSKAARRFMKLVKFGMKVALRCPKDDPGLLMIVETMRYSRVRNISYTSQGALNPNMAEGLVIMMNGHFFKGVGKILGNISKKPMKK